VRPRVARAVAGGIVLLCLAATAASIPIGLAARERVEPGQIVIVGDPSTPRTQEILDELEADRAAGDPLEATFNPTFGAVVVVLLLLWLGVGLLVVSRQPGNWAGWLFIITGAPFPLLVFAQALVIYGVKAAPGSVPFVGLWALVGEYALYPVALLPLLFLLYPDGHPPSRRWRWAVAGLVGGTFVAFLGFLFRPGPFNAWIQDGILYENPIGIDGFAAIGGAVILVGTVVALGSALSTVLAVRQRFRRSTGEERQRMRWLAFVASLAGILFVLQWVIGLGAEVFFEGGDEDAPVFEVLFLLTAFTLLVGIPAAYLVAIFRYRLYDLDVVVKKTVVVTTLVVVAVALYAAVATGVGLVTGSRGDATSMFVTGIAIGLLFQPARAVARRFADRVVYGRRATPYEVLAAFGERVGGTYSTEDVLPRMAQLLGQASGARTARVWLRVGGELRPAATWPPDAEPARVLPVGAGGLPAFGAEEHRVEVRHQGETLGALSVEMPPNDPMDPEKERLLRDVAAQAGLVLRNVRLIEELRASRGRLVKAQDEERRKLERNLHDGAQQQIVSLAIKVRLAKQLTGRDPDRAADLLDAIHAETQDALENLRVLARGIYPPLLADQGLVVALEAQARRAALPVAVEPDGVPGARFPQEVEAAVYFCVLEALQNVAKYAEATSATVRLSQGGGHLRFEVRDDGRGFDPQARGYGTGLQGMADRLEALGGTVRVSSRPGEGTTVAGELPVGAGEGHRLQGSRP
jgi:signal transduction histidine kinase